MKRLKLFRGRRVHRGWEREAQVKSFILNQISTGNKEHVFLRVIPHFTKYRIYKMLIRRAIIKSAVKNRYNGKYRYTFRGYSLSVNIKVVSDEA